MMKERITQAVEAALSGLGIASAQVALEYPAILAHGDYATGVALKYAKELSMSPRALAEAIVEKLGEIDGVSKIEIAGPGFINFYLSADAFAQTIAGAASLGWGRGEAGKGSRVMVEYTDPNPFKEFHIGHLMSNAIGESIARLIDATGATVHRANYQGDVGPHVAKAIWGVQKLGIDPHNAKELGRAYAAGASAYESDPEIKKEIDEINARVYDRSDASINAIYDAGRRASLDHFEEIYRTLGTKFDLYFFESETAPRGLALVKSHPKVFEESDGAIVYKGERAGLHTRVFVTSRGLPAYEAKELGLAELKNELWPFDISITITASEQSGYFAVVLAALHEIMPDIARKMRHVSHGMMRLPTGKMSSRTGDVITGESLLAELKEEATARASESRASDSEQLAQDIAVAAIKYQILKQASGKDIIFDRERALSLDGDSGPYLQYAYARTCAILEKAGASGVDAEFDREKEPNDVVRLVHRFPEIVAYAARELEPHLLTNYLLQLGAAFNSWYAQEQILDGTAQASHKVAIVDAVRATLKNGLSLLGIPAPEKM